MTTLTTEQVPAWLRAQMRPKPDLRLALLAAALGFGLAILLARR